MIDSTVLLYGKTELPADDCKVKFKNKHGKEYVVEITRLIQVFNNNIWENKKRYRDQQVERLMVYHVHQPIIIVNVGMKYLVRKRKN